MTTLTTLVTCALAARSLVDLWLDSSLFAGWRARVEARGDWLGELAGCSYCLSFHGAWLALLAFGHGGPIGRAIVMFLAVSEAARLVYDLSGFLVQRMTTPPAPDEDEDELTKNGEGL